jgi:hypothetical protein
MFPDILYIISYYFGVLIYSAGSLLCQTTCLYDGSVVCVQRIVDNDD